MLQLTISWYALVFFFLIKLEMTYYRKPSNIRHDKPIVLRLQLKKFHGHQRKHGLENSKRDSCDDFDSY